MTMDVCDYGPFVTMDVLYLRRLVTMHPVKLPLFALIHFVTVALKIARFRTRPVRTYTFFSVTLCTCTDFSVNNTKSIQFFL